MIDTASSTIFYHFDKKKKKTHYKTFIDNKNVDIKFRARWFFSDILRLLVYVS